MCLFLFWAQALFLFFGDADSNFRRTILVVNLVFLLWQAIRLLLISEIKVPFMAYSLFVFLVYESIYAALNIEMLTSYLPTIFGVFLFFHVSFLAGYSKFSAAWLWGVGIALFAVYVPQWLLYNDSRSVGADNLYRYSNNFGYLFLLLVPLFMFLRNRLVQILLVASSCALCVLCYKRGAILLLSGVLLLYVYSVLRSETKYKWAFLALIVLPIFCVGGYYLHENADTIFYRFRYLSEGSGRSDMYTLILQGFGDNAITALAGHGFFTTYDLFYEKLGIALMAHCDYLQVLYDGGLIGVAMYALMLVGGLKVLLLAKRHVPEYSHIALILMFIWAGKALFSGVMVDKSCAVIFLALGYIAGEAFRRKNHFPAADLRPHFDRRALR